MNEKLFTGDFVKISNFNQENFVGEGSSPLSCRKYLWIANPVFRKIYAHKWLCTAVCGHNIFLVTISWSRRRDLNTRPLRPEESWNCPLCREWLFIAVSAPQEILFNGLVSVVSVYSGAVYGQICGQPRSTRQDAPSPQPFSNAIIEYAKTKIKSKIELHKTKKSKDCIFSNIAI